MVQQGCGPQGITNKQSAVAVCVAGDYYPQLMMMKRKERGLSTSFRVRSSLDATEVVAQVGQVTEVNKDTFWPIVKAAGDKTVVLDMYTQW